MSAAIEQYCSEADGAEDHYARFRSGQIQQGATAMNPITVFLTVAFLAVGAGLGTAGHLYFAVPVVIAAIIIAAALKMANTW
jgi:hypothetical protein